jgi:predicted ArsR family transcriptional regulator
MRRADDRLWDSTRGRLLVLLRGGMDTVAELAAALGLTDNAVRAHLAALGRDGLVRTTGTRRGTRRPTVTYALAAEAEQLFPKEYARILCSLLDELNDRLPPRQLDAVVRAAGRRFARQMRVPDPSAPAPERVAAVLRELGGCCDVRTTSGSAAVACSVCPLAIAANGHPQVCRLVEALLSEVLGVPVRQRCQTNPPHCGFEIPAGRVGG